MPLPTIFDAKTRRPDPQGAPPHALGSQPALPAPRGRLESEDFDIPIHVSGEEDQEVEEPTEIFRPDMRPSPPRIAIPPVRSGTSTRVSSVHPSKARTRRASSRPPPPPRGTADDWDGETVVKRPGVDADFAGNPSPPPTLVAQERPVVIHRDPRPFNPDETMKVDDASDIEIIDDRQAPRRRR